MTVCREVPNLRATSLTDSPFPNDRTMRSRSPPENEAGRPVGLPFSRADFRLSVLRRLRTDLSIRTIALSVLTACGSGRAVRSQLPNSTQRTAIFAFRHRVSVASTSRALHPSDASSSTTSNSPKQGAEFLAARCGEVRRRVIDGDAIEDDRVARPVERDQFRLGKPAGVGVVDIEVRPARNGVRFEPARTGLNHGHRRE